MEQQKNEKTKILILPRILQCFYDFGHLMLKSFFKKMIKKMIDFLIDFYSILKPSWHPKPSQNRSKIDPKSINKITDFLIDALMCFLIDFWKKLL